MQTLAYQSDFPSKDESTLSSPREGSSKIDLCYGCGYELFGADAEACSWQSWGTSWEILGLSNIELLCGSCGEYLREFFNVGK